MIEHINVFHLNAENVRRLSVFGRRCLLSTGNLPGSIEPEIERSDETSNFFY